MNEQPLQPQNKKNIPLTAAKRVALIAVCTSLIEGCKLALAAIPNVEVVTLLCGLFGYVFGVYGIISAVLFVMIEPLIWGFGTWLATYFIYWPLVAFIFMLLGLKKVKNRFVLSLLAGVLTVFFGVLSSFIDVGLFMGKFDNILQRFAIYYVRGAIFYIVQIVCNLVLFFVAFVPLADVLLKIKKKL